MKRRCRLNDVCRGLSGLDDKALFGPGFVDAMVTLENIRTLRFTGERWVLRAAIPGPGVSLREAEGNRFAALDEANDYRMLEEKQRDRAARFHRAPVYLHQGDYYLVTDIARISATRS